MTRRQLIDIDAIELQTLADTFVGEDDRIAALLFKCADRLDRLQERLANLQPNDFDLGVKTAYERVYGRRNITHSEPVDSRLAEALAKYPEAKVKRIPRGVSGAMPDGKLPSKQKPARKSALELAGITLKLDF